MKVLMIYGHPHPEMSLGNKIVMETVKAAVPDMDIRRVAVCVSGTAEEIH